MIFCNLYFAKSRYFFTFLVYLCVFISPDNYARNTYYIYFQLTFINYRSLPAFQPQNLPTSEPSNLPTSEPLKLPAIRPAVVVSVVVGAALQDLTAGTHPGGASADYYTIFAFGRMEGGCSEAACAIRARSCLP